MLKQILATKSHMTQAWTKSGVRIPVTVVVADDCYVAMESKKENRIVAGQGLKKLKNVAKPQRSQLSKAGLSFGLRHFKELEVSAEKKGDFALGSKINADQVLKVGDIVTVIGTSKGKGFTGVVKRHGFAGGPRTHGQSDRERAPGSLGSGTTPGRVFRNKRMAGRSGNAQVSVLNLPIIKITDGQIWIKGIVPGTINSPVVLTKTGEVEFEGLLEKVIAAQEPTSEVVVAEEKTEVIEPAQEEAKGESVEQ